MKIQPFRLVVFLATLLSFPMSCQVSAQSNGLADSEHIDALINTCYQEKQAGAVVAIFKGDDLVYEKARGLADKESNLALSQETLFRIGSVSKQFIAVSVMQLKEKGLLNLEDSIAEYLPELDETFKEITIKHLLSHTSGISDFIDWKNITKPISREELISNAIKAPRHAAAGEEAQYSNSNYVILGAIVERLTGQTLAQYFETELFEKAALENTYFAGNDKSYSGLAKGYHVNDGVEGPAPSMSMTHTYYGGSLISNTADLHKWHRALLAGKLINRESLQECFTPVQLNSGKRTNFGLGWNIEPLMGTATISHAGGVFGFVCIEMYIPKEDLYLVLLSNRVDMKANPSTPAMLRRIALAALGNPVDSRERRAIKLPNSVLRKYEGRYVLEIEGARRKTTILIMVDGEKLYYGTSVENRKELRAESETVFFVEGSPGSLEFLLDDTGGVIALLLNRSDGSTLKAYPEGD